MGNLGYVGNLEIVDNLGVLSPDDIMKCPELITMVNHILKP